MMDEEARKVELIRMPRQEQVFEREQVFGRDASSVFPTEGQKAAAEAAEVLKSKLGANRFISESEIQELQKEYGKNTEGSEATKPLAHILLEAKQAKDEAFQNQWKQMKQGKNRPLDEEEVQFVDALEAARREKEQAERKQELDALEAYQLAVRAASEAQQTSSGTEAGPLPLRAGAKLTSLRKPPAASKPTKAKRVIIRKRAQPPSDEEAQQAASKQARLEREELDMVSTSLPVSTMGMSQADDQIRASVAAAECHTTAAAAQLECTSGAQPDVQDPCSKGVTDPSGDSSKVTASVDKQVVQNSGLLTSFLGAYGSDSDESDGGPT
ncbi:hypothetical protein ABBQ32_010824 [Trebouxia sp. C0010 RCD-2024]